MSEPPVVHPLTFSLSPRLDSALQAGWAAWRLASEAVGAPSLAAWFAARAADPDLAPEVAALAAPLFDAESGADERLEALTALAELAGELDDDLLADTLWEGVLETGRAADDPDAIVEATTNLAAIAERHADPLAAAEYQIDFLNWRRQSGHTSDPEQVEAAFDAIVRLAEVDRAQRAAAVWAYRQVAFSRLAEADDDRAVEGDWEADPAPYGAWD